MGLETILILAGITFKWILHPGVIENQQVVGSWCLGIGVAMLAIEFILFFAILIFGRSK